MKPEEFYREKIQKILQEKKIVLDIGGGLRAIKNQGNKYNPHQSWLTSLLERVDYKILDPIPDYHPDIVGDIHHLPLPDNSYDALICISVLEHVANPFLAAAEIHRVLKPGGYCFVYVPFLYYYHAEKNYYQDFWRFTDDGIVELFKNFSHLELFPVRGRLSTLLKLTPFDKIKFLRYLCIWLDNHGRRATKQTSGYNIFLIK